MSKENEIQKGEIFGSYKRDIDAILAAFNEKTNLFQAESRVLQPATGRYGLDRRGIIVEYKGDLDKFDEELENVMPHLEKMCKKLEKRTRLYEYPFEQELCHRDKWVEYDNTFVAYNYEL